MATQAPMSGRKAQAARNDKVILQAAREVFVADPTAPIAAVAERAGVGISALYRRYPSKEDLLRKLCGDGLQTYIDVVQKALADDGDPGEAFAQFMRDAVAAETASLTLALAGTFTPTPELYEMATRANELSVSLVDRTQAAGALRKDVDNSDLGLIIEQISAIHVGDHDRTMTLRQRYLELMLQALHTPGAELPGPAPTDEELAARWTPA